LFLCKSWKKKMIPENQTSGSDFILLGLLCSFHTSLVFSSLFIIFILTVIENALLILLIHRDSSIHSPVYFLLSYLSFMDILHISNIIPKMITNFLSGTRTITFADCGFQVFLSLVLLGSEGLLLMSMSYDRYMAICFPLHYSIHMNRRVCVLMILGSWAMGVVNSCAHTVYVLRMPYCQSRAINHFFCDIPAMLTLACGDTWVYEYIVFFSTIIFVLLPFMVIVGSYGKVLLAVYHMRSREGRKKAYSTCSAHLTVVTFYYVPFAYTYLRPKSFRSPAEDKVVAVFYTILTPVLNPVIYSLRNKEVVGALRRVTRKFCFT
ncbi:Olfactory receptor 2L3, partial [Heterocephalus glaber]